MKKRTCIHCGDDIEYDDYFQEWTHTTGDPQCLDTKGEYTYTQAQPKGQY